ncbi:MAG: nicotinate (nicotinamide) nucleotide adenylyltransferase [Ruminococcaceae bacterium]|nr:nicotinate (nicotinamide) nucleotide adenylyltransferase [Oscillospiraceae bacterium]
MQQIGILGGTFNPPHLGHIHAAVCAADELGLETVLLIPDYLPPHKETAAGSPDAHQRLEMVRLAAKDDPRLRVDDCEILRGGKSYTFDTLTDLHARYPDAKLTFICGTDMFLTLDRWYRSDELLRLARFAVAPRVEGNLAELHQKAKELRDRFCSDTIVLKNPVMELSSSEIRQRMAQSDFRGLAPQVVDYIRKNALFGCGNADVTTCSKVSS